MPMFRRDVKESMILYTNNLETPYVESFFIKSMEKNQPVPS